MEGLVLGGVGAGKGCDDDCGYFFNQIKRYWKSTFIAFLKEVLRQGGSLCEQDTFRKVALNIEKAWI